MIVLDTATLVGMTEEAAVAKVKSVGFKCRIRVRDGKAFMGTADARPDRVNLWVEKNLVTKASVG